MEGRNSVLGEHVIGEHVNGEHVIREHVIIFSIREIISIPVIGRFERPNLYICHQRELSYLTVCLVKTEMIPNYNSVFYYGLGTIALKHRYHAD